MTFNLPRDIAIAAGGTLLRVLLSNGHWCATNTGTAGCRHIAHQAGFTVGVEAAQFAQFAAVHEQTVSGHWYMSKGNEIVDTFISRPIYTLLKYIIGIKEMYLNIHIINNLIVLNIGFVLQHLLKIICFFSDSSKKLIFQLVVIITGYLTFRLK